MSQIQRRDVIIRIIIGLCAKVREIQKGRFISRRICMLHYQDKHYNKYFEKIKLIKFFNQEIYRFKK